MPKLTAEERAARQRNKIENALAILRDPDGTGQTKVFQSFGGEPMKAVPCLKHTNNGRCRLDTGHKGPCSAGKPLSQSG